jgi:hypothetical protein
MQPRLTPKQVLTNLKGSLADSKDQKAIDELMPLFEDQTTPKSYFDSKEEKERKEIGAAVNSLREHLLKELRSQWFFTSSKENDYHALLLLAQFFPRNARDEESKKVQCGIAMEAIEEENRFIAADGYWFSKKGIRGWYVQQGRPNLLENPNLNAPFLAQDIKRLKIQLPPDPAEEAKASEAKLEEAKSRIFMVAWIFGALGALCMFSILVTLISVLISVKLFLLFFPIAALMTTSVSFLYLFAYAIATITMFILCKTDLWKPIAAIGFAIGFVPGLLIGIVIQLAISFFEFISNPIKKLIESKPKEDSDYFYPSIEPIFLDALNKPKSDLDYEINNIAETIKMMAMGCDEVENIKDEQLIDLYAAMRDRIDAEGKVDEAGFCLDYPGMCQHEGLKKTYDDFVNEVFNKTLWKKGFSSNQQSEKLQWLKNNFLIQVIQFKKENYLAKIFVDNERGKQVNPRHLKIAQAILERPELLSTRLKTEVQQLRDAALQTPNPERPVGPLEEAKKQPLSSNADRGVGTLQPPLNSSASAALQREGLHGSSSRQSVETDATRKQERLANSRLLNPSPAPAT